MVDILAAPQQIKTDASLRTLGVISAAHWALEVPLLFEAALEKLGKISLPFGKFQMPMHRPARWTAEIFERKGDCGAWQCFLTPENPVLLVHHREKLTMRRGAPYRNRTATR